MLQLPRVMRHCGASIGLVAMVIVSPRKAAACSLLTFITPPPPPATGGQIYGTALFRWEACVPSWWKGWGVKKKKKEWWRHKEKEERTAERPDEIHPAPRQCKLIPAGSVPMDLSSSLNLLKKKKRIKVMRWFWELKNQLKLWCQGEYFQNLLDLLSLCMPWTLRRPLESGGQVHMRTDKP